MIDDMTLISGSNIPFCTGITVKQPTLRDICSLSTIDDLGNYHGGYEQYGLYVNVFCLKMEDLLPKELLDIIPDDKASELSIFIALTTNESYRELLLRALSFFIVEDLAYDDDGICFHSVDGRIDEANFENLRRLILKVCRIENDDIIKPKFNGAKGKNIFEKIQKGRQKMQQAKAKANDASYSLPNVVSALSAKHPSINLLNIWDLTIYQVYDQFNRTYVNAQTDIIGLRWAAWGKDNFDFSTWFKNYK